MDWQVGDLAVCVDARRHPRARCEHHHRLKEGMTYRVCLIAPPSAWVSGDISIGLVLEGCPSENRDQSFHPKRFRKILPDKHEACEPEFATLLKRKKVSA